MDRRTDLTDLTDLIIALDFPRSDLAFRLIDQLEGLSVIYKVGFELFMSAGPDFVRELVHRKNRVFLDLKLHDIPCTVAKAVERAAFLQVEMMTIHIAGGGRMARTVVEEIRKIPHLCPKILGVSVLTSFDDVHWAELSRALTGHAVTPWESVQGLTELAASWGIDGVVCSVFELAQLKARFPSLYFVVPGIRPEGFASHDQVRIGTPRQAHELGANAVVVGRPIIQANHPRRLVEAILQELAAPK